MKLKRDLIDFLTFKLQTELFLLMVLFLLLYSVLLYPTLFYSILSPYKPL